MTRAGCAALVVSLSVVACSELAGLGDPPLLGDAAGDAVHDADPSAGDAATDAAPSDSSASSGADALMAD